MSCCNHSNIAIEVRDLHLTWPGEKSPSLSTESITIEQGQFVALIGPNGSGKTTLLRCLAGSIEHQGEVSILGHRNCRGCREVAFLPQHQDVLTTFPLSALDVALMGRDVHMNWPRNPEKKDREIALKALETVSLRELANKPIQHLSGGQLQRLYLARALAQEPELLMLDEPFNAIDSGNQAKIASHFKEICRGGSTVIASTHSLDIVKDYCDLVIAINKNIIAIGKTEEVFTPKLLQKLFGLSGVKEDAVR